MNQVRLRLDFDELTEATGFDVDSELIQVLMSTYYGRIVNPDEAILLFWIAWWIAIWTKVRVKSTKWQTTSTAGHSKRRN